MDKKGALQPSSTSRSRSAPTDLSRENAALLFEDGLLFPAGEAPSRQQDTVVYRSAGLSTMGGALPPSGLLGLARGARVPPEVGAAEVSRGKSAAALREVMAEPSLAMGSPASLREASAPPPVPRGVSDLSLVDFGSRSPGVVMRAFDSALTRFGCEREVKKLSIEARGVHDDEVLSFMVRLFSRRNMDGAPDGVVAELRLQAGDKAAWYSFYPALARAAGGSLPESVQKLSARGFPAPPPPPNGQDAQFTPGAAYIRSCRALAASEYFEDQVAGLKGLRRVAAASKSPGGGFAEASAEAVDRALESKSPEVLRLAAGLLEASSRMGPPGSEVAQQLERLSKAHENVLLRKKGSSLEARLVKADMAKIEAALKR